MISRILGTIAFTIILTWWWTEGPLARAVEIGGWKGGIHTMISSTILLGMAYRIYLGGLYLIEHEEEGDDE